MYSSIHFIVFLSFCITYILVYLFFLPIEAGATFFLPFARRRLMVSFPLLDLRRTRKPDVRARARFVPPSFCEGEKAKQNKTKPKKQHFEENVNLVSIHGHFILFPISCKEGKISSEGDDDRNNYTKHFALSLI